MTWGVSIKKVCYSFWVLSSLSILKKLPWIDEEKLTDFILSAQDLENGGIADRPGDMADVFHTLFGVAGKSLISVVFFLSCLTLCLSGLSLLGYPGLVNLDPVYCMPAEVIETKGLRKPWKALDRRS